MLLGINATFQRVRALLGEAPGAVINESYSAQLTAAGGSLPYTWSISSGALPTGLSLNSSTGQITGVVPTGTTPGYATFTVLVTDDKGTTASKTFTVGYGTLVSGLHMDGANAGTTFTDFVDGGAWTAVGNAQTQTAAVGVKFGTASARFDGGGDRVHRTKAGHALGTGDCTIDFWMRPASSTNNFARVLQWGANSNNGGLWFIRNGTANPFTLRVDTYAGSYTQMFTGVGGFAIDTYTHVRLARKSGVWYLFTDGVLRGTNSALGAYNITQTLLSIGSNSSNSESYHGNVDELRIIAGAALSVESFTPPVAPSDFPVVP